ncbi:hypothetical protein MHYP_G00204120 [Metynnis hypsauchen]
MDLTADQPQNSRKKAKVTSNRMRLGNMCMMLCVCGKWTKLARVKRKPTVHSRAEGGAARVTVPRREAGPKRWQRLGAGESGTRAGEIAGEHHRHSCTEPHHTAGIATNSSETYLLFMACGW